MPVSPRCLAQSRTGTNQFLFSEEGLGLSCAELPHSRSPSLKYGPEQQEATCECHPFIRCRARSAVTPVH